MPQNGTFSDWIAINPDRLVDKPSHLSTEEAAALPLGGLTAYRALFTKGGLTAKKGGLTKRLLVTASGVMGKPALGFIFPAPTTSHKASEPSMLF